MLYLLFQSALITSVAFIAGAIVGWWLHHFSKGSSQSSHSDLSLIKDYLAESIKENARLKVQLKNTEEKMDKLSNKPFTHHNISGVDVEAFQAFERTLKEAQLRKYLN